MAGLRTACCKEAQDSFGSFECTLGLKLAAGLSKVVNTKDKTCGEDKCSIISLVIL